MKRIAMVVSFAFFASSKGGKAVLFTQFFVQVFFGWPHVVFGIA